MRGMKENLLLSSIICIIIGAMASVAGVYAIAVSVGFGGVILFILGMSMKSKLGMSPKAIAEWTPDASMLPEAGRVMYRVDVTMDKPKRTTIMCGVCSNIDLIDGGKPNTWTCKNCETLLWEEE